MIPRRPRRGALALVIVSVAALGCDANFGATELDETETGGETPEELVECRGAEYPASAVLVLDPESPAVFVDGDAALAEFTGIRCIPAGLVQVSGVSDLGPLASLERASTLLLIDNPGLTHLDALSSLTHIGSLVVDRNLDLVDASGLANLVSVQFLTLGEEDPEGPSPAHGNDALTQLPELVALVEADAIVLADNDALTSLGSPPAVELVDVSVWNSPLLPFADAAAWGQAMANDSTSIRICGCLDDPNPVCTQDPLPPP